MPRIEQAVLTLPRIAGTTGYEIVARSPGVCDDDARELAAWGPSHDSMLDAGPEAESLNFHPLPSGAWCISRTRSVGGQRHAGGQRVSTQCLVVPPIVLAHFGNNPFAMIHAVKAEGLWSEKGDWSNLCAAPRGPCRQSGPVPFFVLEPLELTTAGAAPVDQALLAMLAADPGPDNMAALVQSARDAVCLAVSCRRSPVPVIAGLFSCLPSECRLEFSFSTGLRFSPRRPFRIVALSGDPAEQCWIAGYPNVAVLELYGGTAPPPMPIDGWARLIRQTLSTGRVPFLAAQLSKRRFHLAADDLPALGLQLLEDMEVAEVERWDDGECPAEKNWPPSPQRADAAHRRLGRGIATIPAVSTASSSVPVDPHSPEVLERLERLDDLVYEAIGGQDEALAELRMAWPALASELGAGLLSESREQYLRYAMSLWEEFAQADGVRQPSRAIRALDVLCLLFGDAT